MVVVFSVTCFGSFIIHGLYKTRCCMVACDRRDDTTTEPPDLESTSTGGLSDDESDGDDSDVEHERIIVLVTKRYCLTRAAARDQQESCTPHCSICLELFQAQDMTSTLDCEHIFHAGCIKEWLFRNPSCPLCKARVPLVPRNVRNIDQLVASGHATETRRGTRPEGNTSG